MNRKILLYFYFSIICCGEISFATTYYVSTGGDNNNIGSIDKPLRNIAYAVAKMNPGDITYVRGGTYFEGMVRFSKSGSASAPIKLLAYPGESPIIDCKSVSTNMVLLQHANGDLVPIGHITIEGFEIRNCYCGIKYYHAYDSVIRKNWIHHNRTQGILGNSGMRIIIDRNIINANGHVSTQDHGIYANGTPMAITNNVIYDNMCFGIQHNGAKKYDPAKHPGREYEESQNWIIANNTIAYQRNCAGIVVWGPYTSNVRIENNILYENRVKGTEAQSNGIHFVGIGGATGSRGMVFRNNLVYASGTGGMLFLTKSPYSIEGVNFTQSGNIVNTLTPKFVNAPAAMPAWPNFTLASSSPAIDRGLNLFSAVKTDFAGRPRPSSGPFDIGAYEYGSDSSLPPPPRLPPPPPPPPGVSKPRPPNDFQIISF